MNNHIIYIHYLICYYSIKVTALFKLSYCILQLTFKSRIQLLCSSCWLSTCSHVGERMNMVAPGYHLHAFCIPLPYPPVVTCILPFIFSTSYLSVLGISLVLMEERLHCRQGEWGGSQLEHTSHVHSFPEPGIIYFFNICSMWTLTLCRLTHDNL